MLKKSKLALAFMPFMLLSCGGNSITFDKDDSSYNLLCLRNSDPYTYGKTAGILFNLGNKLKFDKTLQSSYNVEATLTITEKSFGESITLSDPEAHFSDWETETVLGESKTTIVGFSIGLSFKTGDQALSSGDYIKGTIEGNFKKDSNTIAKFSTTIQLTYNGEK